MKSTPETRIRLKLFGVGGAGGNAVGQIAGALTGLEAYAVNTDMQALTSLTGVEKVQIGTAVTHGLGTGGEIELGARAAQGDAERLEAIAQNADLAFIVTGLGGGTGTGAAPVIAKLAKEQGALVLAFAVLPFGFEGERRRQLAQAGLEQLKAQADAVICIANDKLFKVAGENATAADAFRQGNELIGTGVKAFWQLLSRPGLINLDFAAVRGAIGSKHSDGLFSFGTGTGAEKAKAAVKGVMENPLLDGGEVLGKSETILVSVLGGSDMTLADVQRAVEPITRAAPRGHVILGAAIDEAHTDRLSITIVATANLLPRRVAAGVTSRQPVGRKLPEISPIRAGSVAVVAEEKIVAKKDSQPKQESLPLEGISRGRFEKSEPTLHDGEDLDVPTFIRRGVTLKR